jgi:hypothetical protein
MQGLWRGGCTAAFPFFMASSLHRILKMTWKEMDSQEAFGRLLPAITHQGVSCLKMH